MEEAVALTAAANTIIQDADSVGNALKTVSMRIRGTTVKELEAAGEDTDGVVENTSKLYSKIKSLTAVGGKEGISILGDDGKYLNTYEILTKIAERWEEITAVGNDAALLELIAGKTRGSVVAALLQQPEVLKDAYEDALNAEGSAMKENERYLDSIQGRIDLFNNALQTFWNNLLESDAIKFFVNLGTQILELASAFGELRSIMFVVFTYLNLTKKMDLAKWLFGPQGLSAISKLLTKFTSTVKNSNQAKLLALPPPSDTSSSAGGAPKTPSPSSPAGGYARLGAGTEPLDFDKIYGSKFSRMWQNHIIRLKDSINRVKQDFTDIWQHHNERVAHSVEYASGQFNKLKNTASNIANNVKSAFDKMFARNKVTTQSTDVMPYGDTSKQANKFSQIWQNHIVRLKDSISRVKNNLSTIWEHHNERVKWSIAYTSKQFNKLKVNASKIFGGISKVVQGATIGIKNAFAKISAPVVKIFNGIVSKVKMAMEKIKVAASDTAKAFKERLGYTGSKRTATTSTKQSISPYLDIFQNGADQNQRLTYDSSELDKALDDLNKAWKTKGNAGVTEYISKLGEANNISKQTAQSVAAYASTVTNGGYSSQAASAYVKQHNAAVQASGVAARIAAIGHGILNAALSMGLSILLQFVFEGLGKLIEWIKNTINPLEKLTDELSDMQSELSSVRSEIDSVNSELETTRERIAELSALPSLSFVEAEELSQLKKSNAELERRKTLLSSQEERIEKNTAQKAQETVDAQLEDTSFDGDFKSVANDALTDSVTLGLAGAAMGTVIPGIGTAIGGLIGMGVGLVSGIAKSLITDRISTEDKLEREIENYDDLIKRKRELEEQLQTADDTKGKFLWWDTDSEYDKVKKELDKVEEEIRETEDYIDTTLQEMGSNLDGVEYGQGADEALDYYNTIFDKWEIMYGSSGAKSNAIENLISQERFAGLSNSINEWVAKLKDGDESAKGHIESLLSSATDFTAELEARGMELQDAIDYFTLESGIFDSDTIEGITAQYAHGIDVLNQLKAGANFAIDGVQVNWNTTGADGLFDEDETGKFKARADKFAEILKGVDDTTRETFMRLAESVKNGTLTWEQAANSFQASGLVAACRLVEEEISNLNTEVFKDLGDELSGVIDTFSEFGTALESVANSMEILNTAQTQMANSGRISVKTALELMQSTDNWNELLEIENGNITLVGNATETLAEAKLDLIKKNLQAALATVEAQLAEVTATQSSADLAYTIEESTNLAVQQLAGNMAYLTKLMEAYARQAAGETIDINDWIGQAENAKAAVLAQTDYKKNSAVAIGTEALEQKKAELEAMLEMLEGVDTADEFSDYYDYDKTPGDKDLDGSDGRASDALEALRKKYERQIENLDNQQTYIQNEIDRLEAEDETVSKSYYEKQIELEQEKLGLYEKEREALLKLEMTDEVASALWEVEHAIQESTLRMVEFRQSITDLYVEAFDKLIEAYDNSDDFLSDQQNYIDKYQELMELQGDTVTAGSFQEQIAIEEEKMADNIAELDALRQTLADGMTSGYIEEGSEEWVDLQDKIRAAEEAVLDNKIAIEQYRDELKQLSVDAFELVRNAFGSQDQYLTSQQDYMQGYADRLEAQGIDVPTELYEELIAVEQQRRINNVANLVDARQGLADIEAAGYTAADQEWQDAYQQVVDLEKAIQDNDIAMAEWGKTIRDMDFEKFDRFIGRLDDIKSEIDNVRGLFEDDDVAFKDGTWTEEGITSLGLAYQQMELAQQKSQEYAEKINDLNEAYKNGEMSEKEYYERLQELKDGQWNAIDAYEAAKDAIIDMEEARIDMIEEGLTEEIEAFEELISLKQEELEAERD